MSQFMMNNFNTIYDVIFVCWIIGLILVIASNIYRIVKHCEMNKREEDERREWAERSREMSQKAAEQMRLQMDEQNRLFQEQVQRDQVLRDQQLRNQEEQDRLTQEQMRRDQEEQQREMQQSMEEQQRQMDQQNQMQQQMFMNQMNNPFF